MKQGAAYNFAAAFTSPPCSIMTPRDVYVTSTSSKVECRHFISASKAGVCTSSLEGLCHCHVTRGGCNVER